MIFGEKLKQCRVEKGFTQEQIAEKFQVTRQTVSKWELNQVMPETKKLVEIAEYFDFSLDELLLGKKQDEKKEEKILHSKMTRHLTLDNFSLFIKNAVVFFRKMFGINLLTIFFFYGFWDGAVHWSLCNLLDASFFIILMIVFGIGFVSNALLKKEKIQRKVISFFAVLTGFSISIYYYMTAIKFQQTGNSLGIILLPLYYGILIAFVINTGKMNGNTRKRRREGGKVKFKWCLEDETDRKEQGIQSKCSRFRLICFAK